MRVLVVGINYSPDFMGVARYNTELCEALSLDGYDVRVITAPPYYPEWKIPAAYRTFFLRFEERNGVSIVRAPIYVPSLPSGAKRLVHHASFAISSALCTCWIALKWETTADNFGRALANVGTNCFLRFAINRCSFLASHPGFGNRRSIRPRSFARQVPSEINVSYRTPEHYDPLIGFRQFRRQCGSDCQRKALTN